MPEPVYSGLMIESWLTAPLNILPHEVAHALDARSCLNIAYRPLHSACLEDGTRGAVKVYQKLATAHIHLRREVGHLGGPWHYREVTLPLNHPELPLLFQNLDVIVVFKVADTVHTNSLDRIVGRWDPHGQMQLER